MIETKFQTIYRYAREGLNNSQIRETALAMIAHIAKDEIAEPQLTEAESQLVLGAMPLQGLPNDAEATDPWKAVHRIKLKHEALIEEAVATINCYFWQGTQRAEFLDEAIKRLQAAVDKLSHKEPEPRCPYCGETKANHGDYASEEDWVCPEPRTQPAPSGGEEWTLESEPIHGWTIHGNKRIIARGIYREEDAREIIHNHQLAALVPGLVEALRDILREAEFVGDAKQPFSTWIAEKCRTALTAVANHQKQ